jgi:hypothetical protein
MTERNTLEKLNFVVSNVQNNLNQVRAQLIKSTTEAGDLEPEVRAAIELLLGKYTHAQGAAAIIASVQQVRDLTKVAEEMEVLVAAGQTVLGDDHLVSETEAQAAANKEADSNPLPSAAEGSEPAAADATSATPAEGSTTDAAAPAEASGAGDAAASSDEIDGAIAAAPVQVQVS